MLRKVFLLILFTTIAAQAQIQWTSLQPHLQGRVPSPHYKGFERLPPPLENQVRPAVWSLGQNAAGLFVNFTTDASEIKIRYKVKGSLNMPHMPTIGVSGVDLYAFDKHWKWAHSSYSFKDTVTYTFSNIGSHPDFVYELYLPLYNSVEFMEIGIDKSKTLLFTSNDKAPVIVYGTSIAQGACASRPGLGWTQQLQRKLNRPVINLGFSGNGRLEKPILDLMFEVKPAALILDCLPNLGLTSERNAVQLDSIIKAAIQYSREKYPDVPIILTEHSSGFNTDILNEKTNAGYEETTLIARKALQSMDKKLRKNVYVLSNSQIGLDIDSTVDYAHPNDYGMKKIADAYYALLKKIMH